MFRWKERRETETEIETDADKRTNQGTDWRKYVVKGREA